jgi:hypothetical protein
VYAQTKVGNNVVYRAVATSFIPPCLYVHACRQSPDDVNREIFSSRNKVSMTFDDFYQKLK